MADVLQTKLPFAPWMDPRSWRLPGVMPVQGNDWLRLDEAFAGQMAERDRLIATVPQTVHALLPEARGAADELLVQVLTHLRQVPGYDVQAQSVRRPDGVTVPLDPDQPLLTLGRLVQEDLCLMQDRDGQSVLTGAILCFPASWTLDEKLDRPMTSIHAPVKHYSEDIARRVQRLFDAIRPEQPLWRANALVYDDATLHQPRREGQRRPRPVAGLYLRSERQCLLRLPVSRAVVFSIHTYVVPVASLTTDQRAAMAGAGL